MPSKGESRVVAVQTLPGAEATVYKGLSQKEERAAASLPTRRWPKRALWLVIAASTLSVTLYSEIPLLRRAGERAYLSTIPLLIVPHIMCGLLALLSGPIQFSSRLRRRNPGVHRVLGRIYVIAVLVAAPLAIALSRHRHDPRAIHFAIATSVQAGTWMITTIAAFLTARNGFIRQHREWMVRSYAMTLTFVGTRVLQPIPFWNRHSEAGFAIEIIIITFLAILLPDLAFHWRELTERCAPPRNIGLGQARNQAQSGKSLTVAQLD